MNSIKAKHSTLTLSKSVILSKVSQESIFEFYLGIKPTKELIRNPLRADKNPGCNFYCSSKGTIYFRDWAAGRSWNCIDIVMEKYQCSYYTALMKVTKDLSKIKKLDKPKQKKSISLDFENKDVVVQAISSPWDEAALAYWKSYGVSLETLKAYNVHNIKTVYINNILKFKATQTNPIFVYKVSDTNLKVYRPLATTRQTKWRSTTKKYDVHGWDIVSQNPSKLIIYTSSVKDCMVLYELGYKAFCGTSETAQLSSEQVEYLKKEYPYILIFMDNDDPGVNESIKLSKKLGVPYLLIPKKYHTKDISDFYKKYGKNKTVRIIKKLLSKAIRSKPVGYDDIPF